MNSVILSGKHPEFSAVLAGFGYQVISGDIVDGFIPYERDHVDMQCLILDDTAFVLCCCEGLMQALSGRYQVIPCGSNITGKYPANVVLNALVLGKRVFARLDSLDEQVKNYCREHHYELVNMRQGYTKCACAIVSDHAVITADQGVFRSIKEYKIDVLLIEEGRVKLEGADYGFIGGASGLDQRDGRRVLYFSGNIETHPDFDAIKAFCQKHHTEIVSLNNSELMDIGGMIFC